MRGKYIALAEARCCIGSSVCLRLHELSLSNGVQGRIRSADPDTVGGWQVLATIWHGMLWQK
jgi:hypothetical protein